jgi:hypothetical protein
VPTHSITFDSDAAGRERNAFFVTSMHPLARQAAMYYTTNETAYINLEYASEDIPSGTYHFSVYAWNYLGLNPHFRLVTVCEMMLLPRSFPMCSKALRLHQHRVKQIKNHGRLWKKSRSNVDV